jgi:lipopolysaccharide export system permease protein
MIMFRIALHVALATLAAATLFLVVDFVEVSNLAIDVATSDDLLRLAVFGFPNVLRRVLMAAAPIGALTAIGGFARRSELGAIFSAGVGPRIVLLPALGAGAAFALALVVIIEWLVPPAHPEVTAIRRKLGLGDPALESYGEQSWFKGSRYLFRVDSLLDPQGTALGGVMVLRVEGGRLLERWDVERLIHEDGAWVGHGIVHRRSEGAEGLVTERIREQALPLSERPADFVTGIAQPATLPYRALEETTLARERLGAPAFSHRLELYQRRTGPPTLVLILAIAAAIAIRLGRRQSLAAEIGVGALLGFSVWYAREFERLFAISGKLAPEVAAHLMPALCACLAIAAWIHVGRRGGSER